MNKYHMSDIQNHIEENSQYGNLLKERFINEQRYQQNLTAILQGLEWLGISKDSIKVFENRTDFIIYLGKKLTEYEGYELPLYIGHKKRGLPIPEALAEKCPKEIISLIDQVKNRKYINEFDKELKDSSISVEIFLGIHASILTTRVETLLPDLLSDIERLGFTNIKDALEKINSIYLNYLTPASLAKLTRKISNFLRDLRNKKEEELKSIDLYSIRLKEQLEELYVETHQGLKNIIENDITQGAHMNIITQKVANLFSRMDRLFLGNIFHLKDYERKKKEIHDSFKQEEDLQYYADKRTFDKRKKISELYDEYMFLCKFGSLTKEEKKTFIKLLAQEFEQLYRQKNRDLSLLAKFEKRGLLSVELDAESLIDNYISFMKRTIVPEYVAQCLLDLVSYLPPSDNEPQRVVNDLANLEVLTLSGDKILTSSSKESARPSDIVNYVKNYEKCITILVYDIRGSSYMGIKLHNAAKEQRIKYKFAKEMADVVKKYEGFLLKDTGDGGLVWFSENASSLYNYLYTESVTGKGTKLRYSICSGAELDIISAPDAAKRALLCARDMVQRAEEFIRANFVHYREWFADVAERTLELDGITYALLPPEFKSLFRIGVGIASGIPDRDVIFSANSYGDPDLVGPILSDAHLYSRERQPGRSVIICDLPTLINFVLNIDGFEYPVEEKNFDTYKKTIEELRKTTHGYKFSDYKISIEPKGIHLLGELDKNKALVDANISHLFIDENSNIYDNEKRKIKVLYEVLNI